MRIATDRLSKYVASSIEDIARGSLEQFEAKSGVQALAANPLVDLKNLVAVFIQEHTLIAKVFLAIGTDNEIDDLVRFARTIDAGQDQNIPGRAEGSPSIGTNLPPDHLELPVYQYPIIWPFCITQDGRMVEPPLLDEFMKNQVDFVVHDLGNRLPEYSEVEVVKAGD